MRVNRIVVSEPGWKLIDDGAGVGFVADTSVVSLQGPDESLGHAV